MDPEVRNRLSEAGDFVVLEHLSSVRARLYTKEGTVLASNPLVKVTTNIK